MRIRVNAEHWPFTKPFRITGHTFDGIDVLVVTVESDGLVGRGEAAGVYYKNETPGSMAAQIRGAVADAPEFDRYALSKMLPPGGARNALDCALWDLEAKRVGKPVWQLAGLSEVRPLLTTYTIGADDPDRMAQAARAFTEAKALKLKLIGDDEDGERITAVRAARPDVSISVDANQGLTPDRYRALLPTLIAAHIVLVEQPFTVGFEADLSDLRSPIPIAADESVQDRNDLECIAGRVDVVNIKLDKCGGLTAALEMAAQARRMGLKLMVGNMTGTSLSLAPAFVLGQTCDFVDLDGPLFLSNDRKPSATYLDGRVFCPDGAWGAAATMEHTAVKSNENT